MISQEKSVPSVPGALKAEYIFLAVILVLAALLRFWKYPGFSFSNDELSAINRLRYDTFGDLVRYGFFVDGHPGGVQVFLWYWIKLFGISEASLRFPFVLSGIAAVYFSYLVGKRMFGVVAGLFTAASLSFLEFPLLYSQIARPYGSGLFFCLLMVYFWLNLVLGRQESGDSARARYLDALAYVTAVVLCMYNHYFSFLFALIVGVTGLFLVPKKGLPVYLGSGILAGLLFLPHLQITLNHLTYKGVGLWLGVPSNTFILEHITFILNDSLFLIGVFLLISVLISSKGLVTINRKRMMVLAILWFLTPLLAGWAYSAWVNPVLQHPVLIFSFPFLVMLLFMAAGDRLGLWQKVLLLVLLVCGTVDTVFLRDYYNRQHFGEFRGVADATRAWEQEFGKDNMFRVAEVNAPFYLDHYFARDHYQTTFELYKLEEGRWGEQLDSLMGTAARPYFLFAWTKPAPEGVRDVIRSRYPQIIRNINYGYLSGITLFGKEGGTFIEPGLSLELVLKDALPEASNDPGALTDEQYHQVDSVTEYTHSIEVPLQEAVKTGKDLRIAVSVRVKPLDWPLTGLLVAEVGTPDQGQTIWKSTQFRYTVASPNEWNKVLLTFDLEHEKIKTGQLKVYLWNKDKQKFLFRELRTEVYQYMNHSPFSDKNEIWGTP